tara:strand:- start:2503 stop:3213 length:711 start_codon:yes stop_codon:yes gene_type:complete
LLVSLSEIETTICKAALGIGLPLGLGEDAGLAARHMSSLGIGKLDGFENALHAVKSKLSAGFKIDNLCAWNFTSKEDDLLLSSIIAGPSACDFATSIAIEEKKRGTITLSRVDVPSVVLFEALVTTVDEPQGLHISWYTQNNKLIEAFCWNGSLSLVKGVLVDLFLDSPTDVTIKPITRKPVTGNLYFTPCTQHKIMDIDKSSWRRIKSYADQLLVGATEESRLSGAGPGIVIEND